MRGFRQSFDETRDLRGVGGGLRRTTKSQRRALEADDPRRQNLARSLAQ
jgi:hypothetical protein